MKQSKFSLADVLTVLTALAFGFICFLGKYFSTLGNFSESIIWAAIITVSLAGTAFIAKLLKRTSRNFKTNFILEMVVLLLFTGLTIYFAYYPFSHYFNVSAKKIEIQNKLQISISQTENMFAMYEDYVKKEREFNYEGGLNAAIVLQNPSGLREYDLRPPPPPYNTQVAHKISTLQTDLLPHHYSDTVSNKGIKEVATTWLAKANKTTESSSWKPIGIVNVVNEVEKNSKDWLERLIVFSQVREKGEAGKAEDFEYPLTSADLKTDFTTLGKPTPLSIVLAAVAYLLMLFSWFVTKREKGKNLLAIAPYEVVL